MQTSQSHGQQQQNLIIPQTISKLKRDELYLNMVSTILGIHPDLVTFVNIILFVIPTISIIILKFTYVQYYIITPTISLLCLLTSIIYHFMNNKKHLLHCYLFCLIFGYLWSHHVYFCNFHNQLQLIILSFVSFVTSIGTICFSPIKELFSSTLYVNELNVYSVRYVRLLMLLPMFIIELVWDYGGFLQPNNNIHINNNNNINNKQYQQSLYSYYLRLIISLSFITWTFGYISNIYNVYYYIINNINRFLFGDENKATLKKASIGLLMNCIPIAIYVGVFTQNRIQQMNKGGRYVVLLIGSTVMSIGLFGLECCMGTKINSNNSNNINININNNVNIKRIIIPIIMQLIICSILIIILLLCTFHTSYTLKILCIIDISLFIFLSLLTQLSVPRTFFGLQFPIFHILNSHYFRYLKHIIFRLMFGLIIVVISKMLQQQQLYQQLNGNIGLEVDKKFVESFKRAITQANKLGGHLAIAICLSLLYLGDQTRQQSLLLPAMLSILFFPPLPNNFIMSYISLFTTPKKLIPKYNFMNSLIYFIITSFNVFIMILSIGTLQFSMVFGLPVFVCTIPNIVENQQQKQQQQQNKPSIITSKQYSLYSKISQHIPSQIFTFLPLGHYLLRISKYILLIQIKQQNYSFLQLLDIKGLQVQQVTSCHSKQADTIDKIVQQTWGNITQNNNNNNNCNITSSINYLQTVLTPIYKCVILVPTQNQIKLTGIIQSQEFLSVFKQAVIKSLCFEISRIKYTTQQLLQGDQIIDDLSAICKKDKYEKVFPHKFAEEIGLKVKYPESNVSGNKGNYNNNKIINVISSSNNNNNKVKLPPINNNKNKKQLVNDFMDLLQSPMNDKKQDKDKIIIQQKQQKQTSTHQLLGSEINVNNIKNNMQQTSLSFQNNTNKIANMNNIPTTNPLQLNLALIMSFYHYSVGKFDYLNIKKFYNLLKMQKDQLTQIKFHNSLEILSKSLGTGFKIAVDKITMGETQINYQDIEQYQKNSFLGTHGTSLYNQAVINDKPDIWTISYTKGQISINRLAKSQNDLYMFKADSHIIKSIWNNLKFQLVYATNDNDQRYSIQTHPSLLRNLWTQACQQPFGYPSYHKRNFMY